MKNKLLYSLLFIIFILFLTSCSNTMVNSSKKKQANKSLSQISDNETVTTTKNIEIKNFKLFYYDVVTDKICYLEKDLPVTDNDVLTTLTDALKTTDYTELTTLDQDVTVLSNNLDKANNLLTVNLSKDYYNVLRKFGSSCEAGLLKSVALTYGYNYQVTRVKILIEGQPYQGSHILLQDSDTIAIDPSKTAPFNH